MILGERFNTTTAADYCGVPESTLRFWRSTGRPDAPAAFKVGRRVFYLKSDLDAWLQRQYEATVTGRGGPA